MPTDIVSFPLQEQIPLGFTPLIVPPGKEKYSTTHDEPYRSIIEEADKEFKKAGSFLCIGYGFKDSHIQPKLISQIKCGGKPIVVITKEATAECLRLVADTNVKKYNSTLERSLFDDNIECIEKSLLNMGLYYLDNDVDIYNFD